MTNKSHGLPKFLSLKSTLDSKGTVSLDLLLGKHCLGVLPNDMPPKGCQEDQARYSP